ARGNLTGNGRDLWNFGIRALQQQQGLLADLRGKTGTYVRLAASVEGAEKATGELVSWLKQQAKSKTGPSGVTIAEYDWYLANVQLLPYTWAEELELMQRELGRARSALTVEEHRNRKLPPQVPVASAEEHQRRFAAAVTEYMAFLK